MAPECDPEPQLHRMVAEPPLQVVCSPPWVHQTFLLSISTTDQVLQAWSNRFLPTEHRVAHSLDGQNILPVQTIPTHVIPPSLCCAFYWCVIASSTPSHKPQEKKIQEGPTVEEFSYTFPTRITRGRPKMRGRTTIEAHCA
jgi:hypothetical protein